MNFKAQNPNHIAKEAAGKAAAELVSPGMIVGLGTGSTASYFITALGKRCREGLQISAIATSERSAILAEANEIPLTEDREVTFLDLTVDGADEVDQQKRLIKGAGGALLREKILASMSHEMVVIIDESKLVQELGSMPLPVEIIPFAYKATLYKLMQLGYKGELRALQDGEIYITENHNYLLDIQLPGLCKNPQEDDRRIRSVPGVVETGFFLGLAGRLIVGYGDGRIKIWE